jgi:hypothetical protein
MSVSSKLFFTSIICFIACTFLNIPGVLTHPLLIALVSLIAPVAFITGLGSGFYWIINFFTMKEIASPPLSINFDPAKPHELVDFIDKVSNSCVIAVNNVWLQENWCRLYDSQKTAWVVERFEYLTSSLKDADNNALGIINAIQMADKNFTRENKRTA